MGVGMVPAADEVSSPLLMFDFITSVQGLLSSEHKQ